MQIQCLSGALPPPQDALIVCAGTVTCKTMDETDSGFKAFKKYFSLNQHSNPGSRKGWREDLNRQLTGYQYGRKLPLYQRIAQQDSYFGGIATVADVSTQLAILNPEHAKMNQSTLEEQYKSAVRCAIDDALTLRKLLYIQPLGIGVYGWNPKLAATLFGEVLAEFQSTSLVIHIPIFNQTDQQFAAQLQADITRGLRTNVRIQPPIAQRQILTQATQPSRRHTAMSWSFVLKCLAATCALKSASLLVVTLLASMSLITLTTGAIFFCGSTGIGSGLCTYALFQAAKLAQNIEIHTDLRPAL